MQEEMDVPLPLSKMTIGIVFNLKKGIKAKAIDAEAELDCIDTVYAIRDVFVKNGYNVELLEADKRLMEKLNNSKVDIIFNIAEGLNGRGREAQIPALLSMLGIAYTGSDETTLCVALDKALTKRILSTYHVHTPKYLVIKKNGKIKPHTLEFPIIVKPNAEGSSKGISEISIVHSEKELKELIKTNIDLYNEDMLAEEYIHGREFTVGILGNNGDTKVFEPMEIIYKKPTQGDYYVYSYNVKQNYKEYVEYQCPADISIDANNEMKEVAEKVYRELQCKDFSRIDFRMDEKGVLHFIEINPLPGLAPGYSDYPMLADFCGTNYNDLIMGILNAALKRYNLTSK
ncbi:MAG: ATP-grasp domain-containing protein [Clostridia bacterium]